MTELTLILWMTTGAVIRETITSHDCRELIGAARYTDAIGGHMSRDGADGAIARLSCGGTDLVLMLPPSIGPCEANA